jgi:hypothetical protein
MCLVFIYDSNDLSIWYSYGCGKKKQLKKGIVLYVVMFGYGKRPRHCNANT